VRPTPQVAQVAARFAEFPDGSTPEPIELWSDLKAVYRLFDGDAVRCAALAEPHWRLRRAAARGTVLLLGDTTETDFGIHRRVTGLGPTGDGRGRGSLLHNSLMVDPASGEILGAPGWITIRRGLKKLQLCLGGHQAMKQNCE
jgi:hypothetical protein